MNHNFLHRKMEAFLILAGLITGSWLVTNCGEGSRHGYRVENREVVLYRGFPASRAVIGEADAASFVAINDAYGKDKKHVFYLTNIIPKADPTRFAYLGGSYSRDQSRGYSRDQLISQDGAHFEIIPNPDETVSNVTAQGIVYAHDRLHVYKDIVTIGEADPASFTFVPMFNGNYLTRDRKRIYFQDRAMEGAVGARFQKISDFHFKDNKGAWGLVLGKDNYWSLIEEADPRTFSGIGKHYAKDKKRVYFSNYVVEGADPETFKETIYLQASDKNGDYSSGYRTANKN